jgi:hypothetical protein
MTFSLVHIALTAAVCALIAGAILYRRIGMGRADGERIWAIVALAIGLGLVVVAWREVSNMWRLNGDFAPGVSVSDVGSGLIPLFVLLALTPVLSASRLALQGRDRAWWPVMSAIVGLALFVCNVVLI